MAVIPGAFDIRHEVPGLAGAMGASAFAAGRGEAKRFQAQLDQAAAARQLQAQLQEQRLQEAASQNEAQRQLQIQMADRQFEQTMQRDQALADLRQKQGQVQQDYALERMQEQEHIDERAWTTQEKRERGKIIADMQAIRNDDTYNDQEKAYHIEQLKARLHRIRPNPERLKQLSKPKIEEQVNQRTFEKYGLIWSMNEAGELKPHMPPKPDPNVAARQKQIFDLQTKMASDRLKLASETNTNTGKQMYTDVQIDQKLRDAYGPQLQMLGLQFQPAMDQGSPQPGQPPGQPPAPPPEGGLTEAAQGLIEGFNGMPSPEALLAELNKIDQQGMGKNERIFLNALLQRIQAGDLSPRVLHYAARFLQ